jgi:hypothetical protein
MAAMLLAQGKSYRGHGRSHSENADPVAPPNVVFTLFA